MHHSRMNSIFSEESTESGDIFHATRMAHQLFKIREVFTESIESESLFKEPSVRDEMGIFSEVFEPMAIDEIEIDTEFEFNDLMKYKAKHCILRVT